MASLAIWVRWKLKPQTSPLKDLCINLLARRHSPRKNDSSSEAARDIPEQIELSGAGVRAGEMLPLLLCQGPPWEQSADRRHLAFVEPSPCLANSEATLAW